MALHDMSRPVAQESDGTLDSQISTDRHGFIKISRKADADPLWREPRIFSRWEAWEYMIRAAAFAPHRRMIGVVEVDLERGEFIASLRFLATRWQWSVKRVRRFLEWLMEHGRIVSRKRHTKGTVYLLVNYELYQSKGTVKGIARAQRGHKGEEGIEAGKKKLQTTWMTPYWDLWHEEMGAPPIAGKLAKFLKPVHDQHGADEVVPRLRRYLRETNPQYINVSRFAETYAKWDPALSDDRPAFPGYPHV